MNPQDLEMYLQNMGMNRMRRPVPPGMRNMMSRPMPNGSLLGNSQLPPQLNNMPIEQILAQVINSGGGGNGGGGGGGGNGGGGGLPPGLPPMPMRPPPQMMRPPPMTPQPVRPPIRRV